MNFRITFNDGEIVSYLEFRKSDVQNLEIKHKSYTNDLSFRYAVHKEVQKEAQSLIGHISAISDIYDMIQQFEHMAKSLLLNEDLFKRSMDLRAILFVNNSILNTASRALSTGSKVECTPHPGYFAGRTSFWCQEDYLIDVEQFVYVINNSGYHVRAEESVIFNYLIKIKEHRKFITLDKLMTLIETKESYLARVDLEYVRAKGRTDDLVTSEDCRKGSDLACCGNYSGCCWYSSIFCLEHDIICLKCDKWHCGPACKPNL